MKRRPIFGFAVLVAASCAARGPESTPESTEQTSQAIGTAVYVDCENGDDTASGSSWAPVHSIRRAMKLVAPGGAIDIRPGRCVERVDVTKSSIVIQRDPATPGVVEVAGDAPILLDYTNIAICDPGALSGNRACNEAARGRYATFDLYDVHDVTIRDLTITQDQNAYCPATTATSGCIYEEVRPTGTTYPTENFGHYFEQTCLTVSNPDGLQNTCEERPSNIGGAPGLYSGCCVVPRASGTPEVYCNMPHGPVPAPNTPPDLVPRPPHVCGRPLMLAVGISIQGASYGIHIQNDDLTRIKRGDRTKWMSAAIPILVNSRESDARVVRDVHVTGCRLHELPAHDLDGNMFGGLLIVAEDNVDGFEVGGNTITNVGGAIAPSGNYANSDIPNAPPLSVGMDRARNTWIHDNVITNASSYAIYLDGPAGVLIERNRIVNSVYGIGVPTERRLFVPAIDKNGNLVWAPNPASYTHDVWIRDNVVASDGFPIGEKPDERPAQLALAVGMWLTAPDRTSYAPVRNVAVTNNTFILADIDSNPPRPRGTTVNLLPGIIGESSFVGNVVVHRGANALSLTTSSAFPSSTVFRRTDIFATVGQPVVRDLVPATLAAIGDATGFVADPLLGPNYAITSASPARNKIPWADLPTPSWATSYPLNLPETDVFGGTRRCGSLVDIGADESVETKSVCQ